MEELFKKCKNHKFNCLQYVDLEDLCEFDLSNIIDTDDYTIFIKEDSRQYHLFWGAETKKDFINGVEKAVDKIMSYKNSQKRIFIEFVLSEFVDSMREIGFNIVSEWVDYFLHDLQQMTIPHSKYPSIRHIKEDEYSEASYVTKQCIGFSREFYGEDMQTLKKWNSDKNSCILVAHDDVKIVGICMMNIYGHESEKGSVAWLRELAVCPDYQGKSIGYSLILEGLRWGKSNGAARSFLAVDNENYNAVKLYEALGYKRNVNRGQINMAKEL